MTRGEVAVWAGVGSETVRYYEQRNLIPEPPRSAAGYRQYDISYVDRILFIKRSQELGFSLAEIKELLSLKVDPSVDCGAVKRRAQAKVRDVENKIADLQRMGAVLADLANACSGQGSTSECPILKALER